MTDSTENDDTGESQVRHVADSLQAANAAPTPESPEASDSSKGAENGSEQAQDNPAGAMPSPASMPSTASAMTFPAEATASGNDPYAAFRPHAASTDDEATGFVPAAPSDSKSTPLPSPNPKPLFSPESLPDMSERHESQPFNGDDEDSSHAEFTTVYDIIDTMQQMLDEAKGGLFTPGMVKIDRHEFSNSIVELKKMLPVQLERASALMRESERRLRNARTQANAIIASAQSRAADTVREAKEQAQFLAGQEHVVAIAEQKSKVILDTARAKASTLSSGADRYSIRVMNDLDEQLNKIQQDVQAGLRVLEERQQKAQQESEQH
ncbi:cell division protein [Bifidobacterium aquikefiricola]|uniref:Cell division protein n=1 Tax=Bifidobacterium aquikefiricola TaxID=3059038 RepID=A0AB39U7M4_9BIFI